MIPLFHGRRTVLFAALLLGALLQAGVAAAIAWCVHRLFDALNGTGPDAGAGLVAAFIAAACLMFMLEVAHRRLSEGLGLDYAADVRLALFDHLVARPVGATLRQSQGNLLLPFVGDLTATRQWVSDGLARCSAAALTTGILLILLGTRSLLLCVAITTVMLLGAALSFALSRPLDNAVRDLRRRRGTLTAFISGRLGAVASIQAMGRARHERGKVLLRNEAMNEASLRRAWVVGAMRGIVHFATLMLVLATLFAGASEVSAGRLAPGEVVAALSIVGLLGGAIRDLGRAFELWHPARVARERIVRRLSQPVRQQSESQPQGRHTVRKGLVFSSFGAAGYLNDISLSVAEGDIALIEGPSGAGKSLLLGAVAQLADDVTGEVLFRGKVLGSLKPGARRRTLGLASAMTPLLPGSLGMNLRYRVPDAPAEELDRLIEECGLKQLVARLPQGLDYVLASGGAQLSLGEQQSVMLARALLGTPPLLLLDSIDSHVEPAVVARLADRIRRWPGVVLMAATRPELIACATTVWRLESGGVIENNVPQAATTILAFPMSIATHPASAGV